MSDDRLRVLIGDCREVLQGLPDGSVQCCVTSPPYWGLRDYGHADQMGQEETFEEYVDGMVGVFREVRRVLSDDGTLWLNLGDTYAGAGYGNQNCGGGLSRDEGGPAKHRTKRSVGSKNLIGIPWRVAFALQADGWILRQDIIWAKPNPMPESVTDRCTKAHEYVFLLAKRERYFFDSEAIRESGKKEGTLKHLAGGSGIRAGNREGLRRQIAAPERLNSGGSQAFVSRKVGGREVFSMTRNRRSVWEVSLSPFSGAHFATYPPDLIRPCILAGSRPGDVVLDPFAGSGTTGRVALEEGRRAILVELSPDYGALIEDRTSVTVGLGI